MSAPAVSILMTVFNAERDLELSIRSILEQTFQSFEFLILDDGSSDATHRIVESFADPRIRYVRGEENRGQTARLNEGLHLATAPLIARQDADDVSHRERLRLQVEAFATDQSLCVLGTQGLTCDTSGKLTGLLTLPLGNGEVRDWFAIDNPLIHTSVMFRAEVIRDRLGGYDPRFLICQDYDLWARAAELGTIRNLPQRLAAYRVHPQSLSRTKGARTEEEANLVRGRFSHAVSRDARSRALLALKRYGATGPAGLLAGFLAATMLSPQNAATWYRERRSFIGGNVETWKGGPFI